MSTISEVKQRLAIVREDSWHFRLANYIWQGRLRRTHKACFYWWIRVPVSLVAAGLGVIVGGPFLLAVAIVLGLFAGVLALTWWFCGFTTSLVTPVNSSYKDYGVMFYPYKYSPRHDRQHRYAPYQFVLPPLIVASIAWLAWTIHGHTAGSLRAAEWTGVVLGALAILMVIGFAAKAVGGSIGSLWDRACPTVTFVRPPKQLPEDAAA